MTQENQAAYDEVAQQIDKFADAVIKAAIDNQLSFDVVFAALSQVAAKIIFDFNLLAYGELTDENVAAAIAKFNSQTEAVTKFGLENMRAYFKAQQEAEAPRIITEV